MSRPVVAAATLVAAAGIAWLASPRPGGEGGGGGRSAGAGAGAGAGARAGAGIAGPVGVGIGATAAASQFLPGEADAQRRAARALEPAPLEPPIPAGPRRPTLAVKLRFYADPDYRAGLFRWADRTKAQLSQLNQFIEPAFGVRLEAESFRRWHRSSGSGDVGKLLEELMQMDPGQGVDWVVAYVTALPLVTNSIHQVGAAHVLGRHFVLRGMASAEEAASFNRSFDQMEPAERERLYALRKWHKETAIFLHEWLHTLGAIHSTDPQMITHPSYTNRMRTLAPIDAELAAESLQARLEAGRAGVPNYAGLRAALERANVPEWARGERDQLLALLSKMPKGTAPVAAERGDGRPPGLGSRPGAAGAGAGAGAGGGGGGGGGFVGGEGSLPREDREIMERAVALLRASKGEEAWKLVHPLAPRHPDTLDVQRLLCRLGYVPGKKAEGMAACERARALAPNLPDPYVDSAQAHLMRKETAEAYAAADQAAERARTGKGKRDVWLWIARLYGQLGALTRAEAAITDAASSAEATEVASARDTVARERRNLGLQPSAGDQPRPSPEQEMGYVAAFRRALRLLDTGRLREARAAMAEARRHVPDAAGNHLLTCELDLRQGRRLAGEKACRRALELMKDLPRAHYLMGHAKLQAGARDAAVAELKLSIDLDPRDVGPWETLADVYKASGKRQELAALKAEYEKIFSKPLK